ncbi:hypothetical protein NP493_29g05003 [Ridgeia piscesae]|uniref:Probable U3 small nucleolar RNA-associated protein 11 n=1 Tax=Ridgeia piscesae TaxID=27915 RepID=A0AAD9PCV3_RIDPI|nr:hypothetical protein NP493_29g05003 [Ridgeia piscesae]
MGQSVQCPSLSRLLQPQARAHLGLLPKKKDYQERAKQFHKKERTLKVLKRKALDKNPDEFYFKMVRTRLKAFWMTLVHGWQCFGIVAASVPLMLIENHWRKCILSVVCCGCGISQQQPLVFSLKLWTHGS